MPRHRCWRLRGSSGRWRTGRRRTCCRPAKAAHLKDLGCTESLDVRRAMALGELARRQLALDLTTSPDSDGPAEPGSKTRPVRAVVLYLYLHPTDPRQDRAPGRHTNRAL